MQEKHHNFNENYIHHQDSKLAPVLREIVFGIEDGMVSTLGSITGIAIGSGSHSTVIMAGVIIIAVESISMGIGSYLSNKSEEDMENRKISEEREEIHKFPEEEKEELYKIYLKEGWPETMAMDMVEVASKNKNLMLQEMSLHELKILPNEQSLSTKGAFYMFISYILGGLIPLSAYFFMSIESATPISVGITLSGLFVLGMTTTKFTKQPIIKSGLRMLVLGGIALAVGLLAGTLLGE